MPTTPWILGLTVTDSAGSVVVGSTVTFTNETTSETQEETTNSNGRVLIDVNNFTNGFTNGDFINYIVSGTGTNGDNLRMKIVSNVAGSLKKFKCYYT